MIIRITKENGDIAQCEIAMDEMGNWFLVDKKNMKGVYADMEQNENGFQDRIEIDL